MSPTGSGTIKLPSDTDDESQSGFSRDVEVSFFPGLAGQPDFIMFLAAVLLDVLLSTFEDLDTSGTTSFQVLAINLC